MAHAWTGVGMGAKESSNSVLGKITAKDRAEARAKHASQVQAQPKPKAKAKAGNEAATVSGATARADSAAVEVIEIDESSEVRKSL